MGVQINGSEGNVIATKGTYSGNVTIGGTLTYEDVTNIDSVGLVTARTGIEIGARPGVAASIVWMEIWLCLVSQLLVIQAVEMKN